ncbi:hypothetical protein L6452_18395 [Arctium lappa]|uniref:Uncharacterized protein n=1 Tax=Arctium lappa TaxID=4217 RepID=A0ACB9C674_ARCLA|nr:hypothetical protein L6452_18395 [Arctium lappa]
MPGLSDEQWKILMTTLDNKQTPSKWLTKDTSGYAEISEENTIPVEPNDDVGPSSSEGDTHVLTAWGTHKFQLTNMSQPTNMSQLMIHSGNLII